MMLRKFSRSQSSTFRVSGHRSLVRAFTAVLLVACGLSYAIAAAPDCTGPNRWPAAMAFVHLKNAGIIDNAEIDLDKTKTIRLASEKIGEDLYRQIHRITFTEASGRTIEVITSNDVSSEECSMSAVDVYIIARRIGGKS